MACDRRPVRRGVNAVKVVTCIKPPYVHSYGAALEERFWSRVDVIEGDGCWEWTGRRMRQRQGRKNTLGGYGVIDVSAAKRREPRLAHRVAWEITRGTIPPTFCVCHRCDNPPCVRPDHLFLGTARDNIADMLAKGRQAPSPTFGSDNPANKNAPRFAFDGQVLSLREWSTRTGLRLKTLKDRVYGLRWPIERALTEPYRYRCRDEAAE